MTNPELDGNEVEAQDAELLPPREAMSIIPTSGDLGGLEGLTAGGSPTSGAAGIPPAADGGAGTTAADAGDLASTHAAGSESGSPSTIEDDRHDTVHASDSATAES